jgi:hypothetical protein
MIATDTYFQIAKANVIAEVAKISATGAKFASVTYTNAEGETARYTLLLGADYGRLLRTSLIAVSRKPVIGELNRTAKNNVVLSLNKSIKANDAGTVSDDYNCKDTYEHITPGIKANTNDGVFHIYGIVMSKKVLIPVAKKADTRRPLTKAQDELKAGTAISKYRQFKITSEDMHKVVIGGRELVF